MVSLATPVLPQCYLTLGRPWPYYLGMTRYLILAIALTACVDPQPNQLPTDQCGIYPSHGHYSVTYDQRAGSAVAVLPRADFDALVAERIAAKEWALCVGGEAP